MARINPTLDDAILRLQNQLRDSNALVSARDAAMTALRIEHQATVDGLNGQIAGLRSTHQQALDAKAGEIAALRVMQAAALDAKDGEIAALRLRVITVTDLDTLAATHARTMNMARSIIGVGYNTAGKTCREACRDVVTHRLGAEMVDDQGDEWVSAAFAGLAACMSDMGDPPIAQARLLADKAKERRNVDLRLAWGSRQKTDARH